MVFGYLGIFNRYRMVPSFVLCIFLCGLILIKNKFYLHLEKKNENFLWQLVLIYIFFSALRFNIRGISYIILIINGCLWYYLKYEEQDYKILFKEIKAVSLCFALFTIVNYYDHEIVIHIFKFILTNNQIKTIYFDLNNGGIPGIAGESSYNAFCMTLGVFTVFPELLSKSKKYKVCNVIYLIIMLIGIGMTAKRSVLLLAVMLMILMFALSVILKPTTKKSVIVMMTGLIVIFVVAPSVILIVKQVLTKGTGTIQLSNREWFWNIAFEMFHKRPLFGNGINTYDYIYNARKASSGYIAYAGAHNSYIQFLAELGIVGTILYVMAIIKEIITTSNILRKEISLYVDKDNTLIITAFMGILFCILYAISENTFYQPQQLMCFFIFADIARSIKRKSYI